MKVLVYSAKEFEIPFLEAANANGHPMTFTSQRLTSETAMMAVGYKAVSIFSADDASDNILEKLRDFGVKYISLRSAGHDNVNLTTARKLKLRVANAPDYSPNAIAEHAVALLMGLNRKLIRSHLQVRENNFSLNDLVGFDLHGKTCGVIGTGRIGSVLVRILNGFGCKILARDLTPDPVLEDTFNVQYGSLEQVASKSDMLFLCVPLNGETHHLVDRDLLSLMKNTATIINVARGGIVNTRDILNALDTNTIEAYGTDVYEKESGIFFYDHSKDSEVRDEQLQRLINHPRVLLTPHQAFATREALQNIAQTTFYNLDSWEAGELSKNEL